MSQNGVVRLIFSICFQWCALSDMSGCSIVCILSLCLALCVCGYVSQSETPGFMRESPLSFWSSEGKYPRQVQKAHRQATSSATHAFNLDSYSLRVTKLCSDRTQAVHIPARPAFENQEHPFSAGLCFRLLEIFSYSGGGHQSLHTEQKKRSRWSIISA